MNKTEICNLALSYLAKGRITDMAEETEVARQCKIHYDHCRRRLLKAHAWGFAKRTIQLALTDETVPHYAYVYAYPARCLDVHLVFDELNAAEMEEERYDYEISATAAHKKAILTDIERACCRYTYDIEDTDMFSDEFVEALARLMAANMAPTLTGNSEYVNINYQMMQAAVSEAKLESAREQERKTRYSKGYSEARFR